MSQPGLVEGVTSESDYSEYGRHCSSILPCVGLRSPCHDFKSWHCSSIAVLQKRQGSRNSLTTLYIIPLHLCFSLPHFLYAALRGWRGEGEKVRGTKQEDAEGIRMYRSLIQLQHSEKKAQAAFTTHWREPSHFDQDNLFSQSALQYLAYLCIICPLAKLFHFWSTWWDSSFLVLILEIREMGGKMLQNGEDVSFFPSSLWHIEKVVLSNKATVNWDILRLLYEMKITNKIH